MNFEWIFLISVAAIAVIALTVALVCFFMVFYSPTRKPKADGDIGLPDGEIYEKFRPQIYEWARMARALPHRDVEIKSFDGLTLRGKYYESIPGAPIELMMHGYKGNAERDMSGGIVRSRDCGHNALVIDQRASGRSDGHVISFGINESRDCISWINFIISDIDPNAKIILTGVSMGAATVMIAAGEALPKNVIAVLADCGYTSAKDIIKKVIKDMKLPAEVFYPFVKLGARLYGKFDLEEKSPIEALKSVRLPIIFFHGDADDFVPSNMSQTNFDSCASENKVISYIKDAGHGLAYPADMEGYVKVARAFFEKIEKA